ARLGQEGEPLLGRLSLGAGRQLARQQPRALLVGQPALGDVAGDPEGGDDGVVAVAKWEPGGREPALAAVWQRQTLDDVRGRGPGPQDLLLLRAGAGGGVGGEKVEVGLADRLGR